MLSIVSSLLVAFVACPGSGTTFEGPFYVENKGVWQWNVSGSSFSAPQPLQVLLPSNYSNSTRRPLVMLPTVEPGLAGRYGDGLMQVQNTGFHDHADCVVIIVSYDYMPWGCDSDEPEFAQDSMQRQESYLLQDILPFLAAIYPYTHLSTLSFSKGGYAGFTHILRHPDTFAYVVSWDSPLVDLDILKTFKAPCGSEENFAFYDVSRLLQNANVTSRLQGLLPRLALLGHHLFGPAMSTKCAGSPTGACMDQTRQAHELLDGAGVPHVYNNTLMFQHEWGSGWVPHALDALAFLWASRPSFASA
eukprot:gene2715-548_t